MKLYVRTNQKFNGMFFALFFNFLFNIYINIYLHLSFLYLNYVPEFNLLKPKILFLKVPSNHVLWRSLFSSKYNIHHIYDELIKLLNWIKINFK